MKSNCRAEAAKLLVSVTSQGKSLNQLFPEMLNRVKTDDQSLFRLLCFGTLRFYHRYQIYVKTLIDKPLKPKDTDLLALIMIGCYQLEFTRIPVYAAINSCVEASKALGKPWAKGLVNAVLRNFQRNLETLQTSLKNNETFHYSHPPWMIQQIKSDWPEDFCHILTGNNIPGPMTLRVNRLKTTRTDYINLLTKADIPATLTPFSEWGIQLDHAVDVLALPGFTNGLVSVQDEAAQLAGTLLKLEPNQRVLDACCAPGGKTGHILELGIEASLLAAIDADELRLKSVESNLDRLGFVTKLLNADAGDTDQWWHGEGFDRILLDAPCSASGVIRRHPDIKLLRKEKDISALSKRQLGLLQALWKTLKPGGILLYATCSVFAAENEQVIERFLQCADNASVDIIKTDWGKTCLYGRQLFPTENSHDGFYYSRLIKKG